MHSVFVSHSSRAIKRAVRFKELMQERSSGVDIFLSSDWDSIRSGAIWVEEIEKALSCCRHFVALVTSAGDACSPWINYEIGTPAAKAFCRASSCSTASPQKKYRTLFACSISYSPGTRTAEWASLRRWAFRIPRMPLPRYCMRRPKQMPMRRETPNQAMQRTAGRSAFSLSMTSTFNLQLRAPSPAVADLVSR